MARSKGKETLLELCISPITLGNGIAVHILEYLSVGKALPNGFNELAVEFMDTSRVLFSAKNGLTEATRARTQFPPGTDKDLREQFRQIYTNFSVLNQVVNKFLENEKKQGFGKLGKGFRMMFADSEIEKLRLSVAQLRQSLMGNPLVLTWTISASNGESSTNIGYTALAAVLDIPDPTQGSAAGKNTQRHIAPSPPREDLQLPPTPTPAHAFSSTYQRGIPSPELADPTSLDRERFFGPSLGVDNRKTSGASRSLSNRSSTMGWSNDNMSETTAPTSIAEIEEMMSSQSLDDKTPQQAVRIVVDLTKVPRWTPKHRNGAVSAASRTALLVAVQQKNHKMVEQILDYGVPADNGLECNLLNVAIINYDLDSIRLLLLFGADPNAKDKDGFTPLYTATQAPFLDAAQLLLKYGADPNVCGGPRDENPFALSLNSGKTPLTDLYLKHGADPDAVMDNGNTPFIQAMSKTTAVNLVELMLVYNADPNNKNGRGETALFRAIQAERIDLVSTLMNHGANPDLPGPKHMLWPAVHQPRILEMLLEQGANLQRAPGVLELATSINSHEAVTILLKHGADPNAKKDGIFTPLCTAIRDNRGQLVDVLIAAGADPNLAASEYPAFKCVTHRRAHLLPRILAAGANPGSPKGIVETAVAHNDKDSLLILLQHKVDPNARSSSGHTPLTTAIRTKRLELLDVLLSHGADPAVRGQEWPIAMAVKQPEVLAKLLPHMSVTKITKGALEMAVVADELESVKLLLAKGVDVEEKNGGVFSPLTTSIREDRKAIFRYLIDEAGADPNAPGEHLPIIKAIRRHREDDLSYIEHLLEKGADINLMYRGWNAVLQALDNGDTQILKLLADLGHPDLDARDEMDRSVLEIIEDRGLQEERDILLGGPLPSPQMKQAFSQLREMVRQ